MSIVDFELIKKHITKVFINIYLIMYINKQYGTELNNKY